MRMRELMSKYPYSGKGRKRKVIDESDYDCLRCEYLMKHITKAEFARELGVSRPTLDKLIAEREPDGKLMDRVKPKKRVPNLYRLRRA